jgi:hypothetical protein
VQVGCITFTVGAAGPPGTLLITTFADDADVHPAAFVTENVYVPGARPPMIVVIVLPVILPGLIIQSPAGKLVNTTDPAETAQSGCVIMPMAGAVGVTGCASTVKLVRLELQPFPFCAVSVCGPGAAKYPFAGYGANAPPSRLNVNPIVGDVIVMVPVAVAHVGCTILMAGAGGIGCALIITLDDEAEVHPAALATVNV